MNASPRFRSASQGGNMPLQWFVMLFATITYAAFSTRAILNPYEINHLIDTKRILSVLFGAAVLWLALRAADRLSGQKAVVQAVAILRISAMGVFALLAAREIYDLVESGQFAASLALNIRFLLTWIGYFAAAIAGFLAFSYHRQLQAVRTRGAAGVYENSTNASDEVKALLMVLRAQTGYETADVDIGPDVSARAERQARIDRLLEKL